MRNTLFAVICILAVPSVALAEDHKMILAKALADHLEPPAGIAAAQKTMTNLIDDQIKAMAEGYGIKSHQSDRIILLRREYLKRIKDRLDFNNIREKYAKAYSEIFTEDQLKRLIEIQNDSVFILHKQKTSELSEIFKADFKRIQEEDSAWFYSEINKNIREK